MQASSAVVEATGLFKSLPGVKALGNLGFRFFPGEVQALRGKNGTGMLTLIKMPTGVFSVDQDEIKLDGQVVPAVHLLHYTRLGRTVYAKGVASSRPCSWASLSAGPRSWSMPSAGPAPRSLASCSRSACRRATACTRWAWNWTRSRLSSSADLLTGVPGSSSAPLFGCLVLGLIQTIITFQGTLSAWWTKIVIGVLLFVFILLQKAVTGRKAT